MGYRLKAGMLLLALILAVADAVPAYAENTEGNYTYQYDYTNSITPNSIPTFTLARVIDAKMLGGLPLTEITDVGASTDRVFIVDTKESRIHVFDRDFKLVKSIKLLRDQEDKIAIDAETGNQIILTSPEGVFFHEQTDELYIADTGAERIVVLDGSKYYLKRIITRPDNMIGVTQFRPSKIIVDQANKIYTVVQDAYEGIIELAEDGSFSRYFGLNKPTYSAWDYFWKSLASDKQREGMTKTFAPAFNNLDIDPKGFVYATTTDSAAEQSMFRFDFKGGNAQQKGGWDHEINGDAVRSWFPTSQFVDIAVNDYGVFATLDALRGRIFIYNYDGDLLGVLASTGKLPSGYIKGNLITPSSITWFGDQLVVADKALKCAYVYEMTEFGEYVMGAAKAYNDGDWEKLNELSFQALRLNANYYQAYIDIGRYYLMQGDNANAMYYFELGQTRKEDTYGKAFVGARNQWVSDHFILIMAVIALLAGLLIFSEIRYHRKKVPT